MRGSGQIKNKTITDEDHEYVNSATDVNELKEYLHDVVDISQTADKKKPAHHRQIDKQNTIEKLQAWFYNVILAGDGLRSDLSGNSWNGRF
ncbi:hypothetical protein LCGC14_1318090 [marine sediment metagenome]|uniref:Uncharacterized protein n=1 Tax=marine sediment metagenome TaxID=412755 RepID=A0A0F9N176_9ZZZZ